MPPHLHKGMGLVVLIVSQAFAGSVNKVRGNLEETLQETQFTNIFIRKGIDWFMEENNIEKAGGMNGWVKCGEWVVRVEMEKR